MSLSYRCKKRKRTDERRTPPPREDGLSILTALHDIVFQSLMESGITAPKSRAARMTDELQRLHWKLSCCQEFNYVAKDSAEWRFLHALQIIDHELLFRAGPRISFETLVVEIPYIGDGQSTRTITLRVHHHFEHFWSDDLDYKCTGIHIQLERSVIDSRFISSQCLFQAQGGGRVIKCDEALWYQIFHELGLKKREIPISFVLRVLGELMSRNGTNPIYAVNRLYLLQDHDTTLEECNSIDFYPFLKEGKHEYEFYKTQLKGQLFELLEIPKPLIDLVTLYIYKLNIGTVDVSFDEEDAFRLAHERWEWAL